MKMQCWFKSAFFDANQEMASVALSLFVVKFTPGTEKYLYNSSVSFIAVFF
jgi:hypothetical protein